MKKVVCLAFMAIVVLLAGALSDYATARPPGGGPPGPGGSLSHGGRPPGHWGRPPGHWVGPPGRWGGPPGRWGGPWGVYYHWRGPWGYWRGPWGYWRGSIALGPWLWPLYPWLPYYPGVPAVVTQQPSGYGQPYQQEPYYWYYCPNPPGYYPYIRSCPGGWMKVEPDTTPPK
jgi:hypothetical protein